MFSQLSFTELNVSAGLCRNCCSWLVQLTIAASAARAGLQPSTGAEPSMCELRPDSSRGQAGNKAAWGLPMPLIRLDPP